MHFYEFIFSSTNCTCLYSISKWKTSKRSHKQHACRNLCKIPLFTLGSYKKRNHQRIKFDSYNFNEFVLSELYKCEQNIKFYTLAEINWSFLFNWMSVISSTYWYLPTTDFISTLESNCKGNTFLDFYLLFNDK